MCLSNRLKWLMENRQLTNADLSRAAGVKPSSVSAWLSGQSVGLRAEVALRLCRNLRISPDWLVEGKGKPDDNPAPCAHEPDSLPEPSFIEIFEEKPVLKYKSVQWLRDYNRSPMLYAKEEFAGLNAENPGTCKCVTVPDDSMTPLFFSGDRVIVDTAKTEIMFGKVYCILIDGRLMFRRLYDNINEIIIGTFEPEKDVRLEVKEFHERVIIPGKVIDRKGLGGGFR